MSIVVKSAGLLIICRNKVLLVKPNGFIGKGGLSIPKGEIDKNEGILNAAIRETHEEVGIKVKAEDISDGPYIVNYVTKGKVTKRIYYFIVRFNKLDKITIPNNQLQKSEIRWAKYVDLKYAKKLIYWKQKPILRHLTPEKFDKNEIFWLLNNNYIERNKHPFHQIYIYNYTNKCKKHQLWNETSLWMRGIILDDNYNVIARPFKKFFNLDQIYPELIPSDMKFTISEKLDGSLGILYWINNKPLICTRGSFYSRQAYIATQILYQKYSHLFKKIDRSKTYLFEIIYPENKHIVNYNDKADIFLVGIMDIKSGIEIPIINENSLGFKYVHKIASTAKLTDLKKNDIKNHEGYVLQYENCLKIKIKFPTYVNKYQKKNYI